MCWNFFAFDHGKGKGDDVGKWEIRKEQIKTHAMRLQNAHDIVTFC
jgi:hypothetical protein